MAYKDCETHIDERTVPMYSEPRVLSTGIDAGIAEKCQKKENKGWIATKGMGGNPLQASANFPSRRARVDIIYIIHAAGTNKG